MLQGQSSTNDRKAHNLPFWRQIRWNLTFAVVVVSRMVRAILPPTAQQNALQRDGLLVPCVDIRIIAPYE